MTYRRRSPQKRKKRWRKQSIDSVVRSPLVEGVKGRKRKEQKSCQQDQGKSEGRGE